MKIKPKSALVSTEFASDFDPEAHHQTIGKAPWIDAAHQAKAQALIASIHAPLSQPPKPRAQELPTSLTLREAFDKMPSTSSGPAQVRLLDDNMTSWNARWHAMKAATEKIDTTYFSSGRDVFGFAFMGHLFKKQRAGVKTRALFDATADTLGERGFKSHVDLKNFGPGGKDYAQELVAAGGGVKIFHPLWQRLPHIGAVTVGRVLSLVTPWARSYPYWDLMRGAMSCNHDKILVIDGKVGFTGGRNIERDYFVDHADMEMAWRDSDIMTIGESPAGGLTTSMDREYDRPFVSQEVGKDLLGNWVRRDIELLGAYLLMDMWLHDPVLSADAAQYLRQDAGAREKAADALVKRAVERLPAEGVDRAPSKSDLAFLKKQALELAGYPKLRGSALAYNPSAELHQAEVKILDQTAKILPARHNEFDPALRLITRGANARIYAANPYVVLPEEFVKEMEMESKNGTPFHIVTNSPLSTDSDVTQAFFLQDFANIMARVPTLRIFVATGKSKGHRKDAEVDGKLSSVGSLNFDFLSGYVNSEVGAFVWSESFAKALRQSIDKDMLDPKNGFVEYKIKRNPDGSPLLQQRVDKKGKPVLINGKPVYDAVVEFGPEHHLPKDLMDTYRKKMANWDLVRRWVPILEPLRYPAIQK